MSTKTSLFESASDLERERLANLCEALTGGTGTFLPTGTHSPFDGMLFQKQPIGVTMLEAKCRPFRSDRFDDGFIEYPKYNSLMSLVSKGVAERCFYVFFFSDGVARVWNLGHLDLEWVHKDLNKTSMGGNETVDKLIAYLPNSRALEIDNL